MQRILILGTGSIAARHAENFSAIPDCRIVAAVDINAERARLYAAEHRIQNRFADLDAALAWGEFDAAVNATPDGVHMPTTLQLLAAGKPVFCEKPLAINHRDALVMTEAAERAGLVNMVNLTYRNAHALQAARRMVMAGEIGAIRHVEASYLQSWLTADYWGDWHTSERFLWRLSSQHGSQGVLGDIGCRHGPPQREDTSWIPKSTKFADRIYRLSTFVPEIAPPAGFTFNQFLVVGDEPLLFHTGLRRMFPLIHDAVRRIMPPDRLLRP